jgi:replicative DNA helicase Mcm
MTIRIEEEAKYKNIDDLTDERKTYLDSEIFSYNGQNYKYAKCIEFCEEFIRSYKRHKSTKFHYMEALNSMMSRQAITLVVDYQDICDAEVMTEEVLHSNFFHNLIDQNPKLFIKAFRKAAYDVLQTMHYDYAMDISHNFKVTLSNANMFRKEITDINNDDVGHVIYTQNFVISKAAQKDFTKRMAWICGECGRITYKDSIGFSLARLHKCMYCDSKDITQSDKDAITDTMQEIKVQQRFEQIESGDMPKSMFGTIMGKDMIDMVQAGDVCAITAIVGIQRNPSPAENAIADYYLEILWIERLPDDILIDDDPELEEKVKNFIDPKNEDEGYQNLINSIAPSVMGHEVIKEALLLQLVGSDTAWFKDNSRHRGESNILLVGDAGTAKTKLGYYVYQLYTRATYVAGKVTEAGMTASVDVANKSGHHILTAGAYLLASSDAGGIVVADEMEKTDIKAKDSTAACLDDRQMVEIHKGNIHQSIQINCASLHIANPKTGESWNVDLSIKENTGFENWYLTRFCTWIVRDEIDEELDTMKAKHYLSQFGDTVRQNDLKDTTLNQIRRDQALSFHGKRSEIKTVPEMRMYHKYARKFYHPRLDPKSKAAKKLQMFYIAMRPMGGNTKGFKISMRSLGDLVRFAEESARAHFRNEVLEKDADIAIKLVSSSIASSGFNMFTGKYELHQMEKDAESRKKGVPVSGGFFTADELLKSKTARDIVQEDMERLAMKRQNRFYREIAGKMKKVTKVIRMYALQKCKDCGGNGFRREGGMSNACYSCSGSGGFKNDFSLNDVHYTLAEAGLTSSDITELTTNLIKKKLILPKFNSQNMYQVTKDYKNALLEFEAIDANIELVMVAEMEKQDNKVKDPKMQEKINKLRNMMNPKAREEIRKKLEEVEDDDEEE